MGSNAIIRDALARDVDRLAPRLRPADAAEAWRVVGVSTGLALRFSWEDSEVCRVLEVDGEVAAMWGVVRNSMYEDGGLVWMAGAPEAVADRRFFFRFSRWELAELLQVFPYLWNRVDATYRGAVRWLELLGFHMEPVAPAYPTGAPSRRFWIRRA